MGVGATLAVVGKLGFFSVFTSDSDEGYINMKFKYRCWYRCWHSNIKAIGEMRYMKISRVPKLMLLFVLLSLITASICVAAPGGHPPGQKHKDGTHSPGYHQTHSYPPPSHPPAYSTPVYYYTRPYVTSWNYVVSYSYWRPWGYSWPWGYYWYW